MNALKELSELEEELIMKEDSMGEFSKKTE